MRQPQMRSNNRVELTSGPAGAGPSAAHAERSGDAARRPNGPAAVARGSRRDARPEPAAAPDNHCTTCGCSAPAGEPRGR